MSEYINVYDLVHPLVTAQINQTAEQAYRPLTWVPSFNSFGKDMYHYAGQDILIYEALDSYGAVMWPGVSISDDMKSPNNILDVKML